MECPMIPKTLPRQVAVLLFGVVVPLFILAQAYIGLVSLGKDVSYTNTHDDLIQTLSTAKKSRANGNDYALFSLLYTEHANQKTMVNKQIMKVVIMQIGFAVTSIGMMLIILGFYDGGVSGAAEVSGMKFDFKSGSTGVVVFLAGALMATAGGVLKNDYNTVPIPEYVYVESNQDHTKSINAFIECKKLADEKFKDCFIGFFQKINQGALK
jgi:hypothetical protein